MNDIKKRLAALAIAGFMMTSTSGCGNTFDSHSTINEQSSNQESDNNITLDQLKNYYIVEISDFEGESRLYLTYKERIYSRYSPIKFEYKISDSDVVLTTEMLESYASDFGEVKNVVEIIQYIQKYSTIKENYTRQEIDDIYNRIVEDKNNSNEKQKNKSLTLKQK